MYEEFWGAEKPQPSDECGVADVSKTLATPNTAPTNVQPPTSLVQNGIPLIEAWTPCGTCAVSSSNVLSMSDDLQINRRLSQLRYTRPLSGAGSHHSTTPFRCPPAHTPRVRTIGMSPYQYRKDVSRREAKLE